MSEPIKHRDHLWLVPVFGSTEERAKAEMAERGDREGRAWEGCCVSSTGATTSHVHCRFTGVKIICKMILNNCVPSSLKLLHPSPAPLLLHLTIKAKHKKGYLSWSGDMFTFFYNCGFAIFY